MNQLSVAYPTQSRVLANGLTCVVQSDLNAPGVAVNIWYRVGSSDEVEGRTGFAHLFEHMMFQGSTNVASGEHFALLESAGGMANATTSFDRTNYFATVPTGALELTLWLEADRMSGLDVSQENLDAQREVVKEEKRQSYDNRPYGDLLQLLLSQHFSTESGYGHPTIGSMADLDSASLADVRAFFDSWYQPTNAVITLCGAVAPEAGFDLVERYFGAIEPAGPLPDRVVWDNRRPPNLIEHVGDVPHDLSYLTWATPVLTDPEGERLDVLLNLLTDGLAARLHTRLVRTRRVAASIGAMQLGLVNAPSITALNVRLDADQDLEAAEAAILAELELLASDPPTEAELQRTKAQLEREYLQAMAQVETRADLISGSATQFGDPQHVIGYLDRLNAIESADLVHLAQKWLAPKDAYRLRYRKEAK